MLQIFSQRHLMLADETVYKEWEDIMERAATTASSLEAEQDSGNINRTQSMATLNEPLPQGTGSGSGPRCASPQKIPTIYECLTSTVLWRTATINTRDNAGGLSSLPNTEIFEQLSLMGVDVVHGGAATTDSSIDAGQGSGNITKSPTMPHDSTLPGGHTPGSDEGSMTLHELTILCTNLTNKVKKLEQTVKTSQAKRRTKIIASDDEEDLVAEDPFKQGRSMIEEMDLDAGISLVVPPQYSYGDQLKSAATAKASLKWIKLSHQVNETDRSALVELVNQRKKFFAQQRAKAKRNKPMTPAQQKEYMSNYIKNQEGVGKVHRQENRQTRRFTLKTQEGIGKLSELETIEKLIRFFANGKGNLIEMTWLRALDLGKEVLKTGEYDLWSMRMEQYLTFTDHALWVVIVNSDSVSPVASASVGVEGHIPPKTAEQKLARKNELKAKNTLMLAIPDEHLLKFHACKDVKSLWEAIKNRFGGNKESKKMQKTILKQNYENFATLSQKGLDKTYDRFQKLISQLVIHGELISQEDANLKLLRSLPSI
ncbi:hypothetical protein Tco_1160633 [Tanacetum coccineum]